MLFNNKFNDEEYEGINLKIPYWFYSINRDKLEPILNQLKDTLENSLSFMHPDNQRNIFELDNVESKKEIMENRLKRDKQIQKDYLKNQNDKLLGNIYEIIYDKYTSETEIERGLTLILKSGEELNFEEKDIVTNKYSLNSFITSKFNELRNEIDWRKTSYVSDFSLLSNFLTGYNGFRIKAEDIRIGNISSNVWLLKLTFEVKSVKVLFKKKSGKIFYRTRHLLWSDNLNCYSFDGLDDKIMLDNYTEKNGMFIKNKE